MLEYKQEREFGHIVPIRASLTCRENDSSAYVLDATLSLRLIAVINTVLEAINVTVRIAVPALVENASVYSSKNSPNESFDFDRRASIVKWKVKRIKAGEECLLPFKVGLFFLLIV